MTTNTIDFGDRLSCDLCGDDRAELREVCEHEIWCKACFGNREETFTDFPLAQKASD